KQPPLVHEPARRNGDLADGVGIAPTVLTDVTPDMRVARKESSGPAITILKYDNLDEATNLANNTEFGLGGIVFGSGQDKALEVAEAMNTGSVRMTSLPRTTPHPFCGRDSFSPGGEYGPEGLAANLSYKSTLICSVVLTTHE